MKNLPCIIFTMVIQLFTCSSECTKFFIILKVSTKTGHTKTVTPISLRDIYTSRLMIKHNTSKIFDSLDENKGCILDIQCEKPYFELKCKRNGTVSGMLTSGPVNASGPVVLTSDSGTKKMAVIAAAAVAGVGASAAVAYLVAKKIMLMMQYGSYYLDGP